MAGNSFYNQQVLIGEIERRNDKIRIHANETKGGKFVIDVRIFFTPDDEQWLPTKKGISIDYEDIEQLEKFITEAKDVLAEM